MAQTSEIQAILAQLEQVLSRWQRDRSFGEIVIISGANDYQVEERPTVKHKPVKRALRGSSVIEKVTEN
jgi:hypothetical protein